MMGVILEKSGAAERMAIFLDQTSRKSKRGMGFGINRIYRFHTSFSDSGLVILTPLAKSLSKLTGKSAVGLGLALATGLQLTHAIYSLTPGPLTVAGILNIDIGQMIIAGILTTIPAFIASMLYCKWLRKEALLNSK